MHTVIITDPHTTSLFADYSHLFAPFFRESGKSVGHCRWHKGCEVIDSAVPELYKEIKGHPEWRAIILVRPDQKDLHDPDNPFDFECYHDGASSGDERGFLLRDKPAELVRLTYMLAGFPPLGIKGYQTAFFYRDIKKGTDNECLYNGKPILQSDSEKDINNAVQKRLKEEYKKLQEEYKTKEEKDKSDFQKELDDRIKIITIEEERKYNDARKSIDERLKRFSNLGSIKLKLIEIPYASEERKKHKDLTEKYAFKENRPAEVLILSIREQYSYDEREEVFTEVRRAWQFHDETDSSDFWKVYPNSCRFLCYDLINPAHTLHARELQRFFFLTLTLAVNQIPGRSLQAYLLYRVNLQIDADELGHIYEKYLENLLSFQEIIQERMSRVPELTQDKKKEMVPAQYISVSFDSIEESDVKAKGGKFGLARDCPADEVRFWNEHIEGTRHTIGNILYAPREIVAEKALETRQKTDAFTGIEQVLDRFQFDRVQKRINELEYKIFNTNLYGMLDAGTYRAEVAKAGEAVRKYINHRLTKRGILFISIGSFSAFLFGFVPYLVNSAKSGGLTFTAAFGLVLAACLLLGGGALLTLWFLRGGLIKKIQGYNKDVTDIFSRVKKSADVFSGYFSDICTYMYARSLMSGVTLKKDNDDTAAAIQNAHLDFLKSEIEKNKSICSLYGAELNISSGKGSLVNIDEELLGKWPSKCQFYELSPCNEKNTVKLTTSPITQQTMSNSTDKSYEEWEQYNTGITLDAPYSFIASINLVREEIYDKKEKK